jgi:hypothetical protein
VPTIDRVVTSGTPAARDSAQTGPVAVAPTAQRLLQSSGTRRPRDVQRHSASRPLFVLFVAPNLLLLGVFSYWSLIQNISLSFTESDMMRQLGAHPDLSRLCRLAVTALGGRRQLAMPTVVIVYVFTMPPTWIRPHP